MAAMIRPVYPLTATACMSPTGHLGQHPPWETKLCHLLPTCTGKAAPGPGSQIEGARRDEAMHAPFPTHPGLRPSLTIIVSPLLLAQEAGQVHTAAHPVVWHPLHGVCSFPQRHLRPVPDPVRTVCRVLPGGCRGCTWVRAASNHTDTLPLQGLVVAVLYCFLNSEVSPGPSFLPTLCCVPTPHDQARTLPCTFWPSSP